MRPLSPTFKTIVNGALIGLGLGLFLGGSLVYFSWLEVTPNGETEATFAAISFIFLISGGVVLAGLVAVAFVLSRSKIDRRISLRLIALTIVFIPTFILVVRLCNVLRDNAFAALVERSEPLVKAIHQFQTAKGRPPEDLKELVPDYLASVPGTGFGSFPDYEYKLKHPTSAQKSPWILRVRTRRGLLNRDYFLYDPDQTYLEGSYGGNSYQRFGDWVYVIE
jgi:hypothetical protein